MSNFFYWTISVVIVGILINLASAYLKNPLDRLVSKLSKKWRTRSEEKKAAWLKEVESLRGSQHEQTMQGFNMIFNITFAVLILVFIAIALSAVWATAIIIQVTGSRSTINITLNITSGIVGVGGTVLFIHFYTAATKQWQQLNEAREENTTTKEDQSKDT